MKTVAAHDRPREKLQRLGSSALGDNELMAIVLGHGRANASALDLANALLAGSRRRRWSRTSAPRRPDADRRHRRRPGGADPRRRRAGTPNADARRTAAGPVHVTADACADLCCRSSATGRSNSSACCCSIPNTACCGRRSSRSARSTPASCIPREIFREAAAAGAAAIVLFHNHPSGDPEPSHDDVQLTGG